MRRLLRTALPAILLVGLIFGLAYGVAYGKAEPGPVDPLTVAGLAIALPILCIVAVGTKGLGGRFTPLWQAIFGRK